MKELSWQGILEAQQQDFVQRLKHSLNRYSSECDEVTLSRLDSNPFCSASYHSELITISFDEPQEEELHNYVEELVYKFFGEYDPDKYANYKIGKIGEEAVKLYLGNLVTKVDYVIYEYGNRGTDFRLVSNNNIGIQVKTKSLYRITNKDIWENEMDNWFVNDVMNDFYENGKDRVDDISWSIDQKEINGNRLLICVLLLNGIEADTIQLQNNQYKCVMAGFKPTGEMKYAQSFKMKDLLYSGGIRGYLETLK